MKINWPWAKPKDNYLALTLFIILAETAGLLGTIFTIPSIPSWYATLNKPFFSPPNWLFGPVWTLLYALIGISAYLIWRKYKFGKKSHAYWQAFAIQLILNTVWSPVFFGAKWVGVAFIIIVAMGCYIYCTIREGVKLVPWSGYVLYPYLAWVSFATLLNFAIWILN